MPANPLAKRHIGDGVYAEHDGYQIWLSTQQGNRIALEPNVMAELRRYDDAIAAYSRRLMAGAASSETG